MAVREQPRISEADLRACLQEQYGLLPATLDFLALGLDYNAGVYRVMSEQGEAYFLKVKSSTLYEPACLVPRYLNDQGIASVVAPCPTSSGALWTRLGDWTVILYPYIEGDTAWVGMTDEQWQAVGATLHQIHQPVPPSSGFAALRQETFDPGVYTRAIQAIEDQHLHTQDESSAPERALRAAWLAHQSTIHAIVATMEKLAGVLQTRSGSYVICHTDLHPSNLLRAQSGQVFVIDWDEVMLAPRERDFIFIRTSSADSEALPGVPAFFQGYGQTEIDWVALTYYRYERVIQDVVAFAQEVFDRDDLGDESKIGSAQFFQKNLDGSSMLAAAHTAAEFLEKE